MSFDIVTLVIAILAIGFLIIVHEAGHYIVARWCNMRVDRFSVGFGPPILSRRRGETDFTIGPIPFGGFVQINGMLLSEEVDPDDERAYPNRPVWQRILTIFAGPATNYLAAIGLAFILYNVSGVSTGTAWHRVAGVAENYDAVGKLEVNDVIVKVGDQDVYAVYGGERVKSFVDYVQEAKDKPITATVLRDGEPVQVELSAKRNPDYASYGALRERVAELRERYDHWVFDLEHFDRYAPPAYRVGISLSIEKERADVGVISAAGHAVTYPFEQTKLIIVGLRDWAKGDAEGELMSVVGITAEVKRQIDRGWTYLLEMLMLLNVYLGLFNLFPLPALDGGRLVFLGYEMVTRRRANPKIEATVHMVGIMALMLLLVVVTYNDCSRELGKFL